MKLYLIICVVVFSVIIADCKEPETIEPKNIVCNDNLDLKRCSENSKEREIYRRMYVQLSYFIRMYSNVESNCISLTSPLYLMHKSDGGIVNIALQKKDDQMVASMNNKCFDLTKSQIFQFELLLDKIPAEDSSLSQTMIPPNQFVFWDGKKPHFYTSPMHAKVKEIEDMKTFFLSLEKIY